MNFLEKTLGFDPKTMKLRTELIAGVTTFLTMSYILAVNPAILMSTGMDQGALFTATALASAIATLLLAFMAKLPFAQAPSMGLNAFFAYTLCQAMGYSWQNSLAILLIEGIVFILITFFNVREMIFNAIPNNLRYAISAGIGMFIAFIGLKNAEIIVSKEGTFVGLGAFTAPCLLGIFATLLSGVLMARNVKGALFWGIIATTLIGIPLGVTVFPDHWLPVSAPQDISPIFCQFDFSGLLNLKTVLVVFSLLIVNIFYHLYLYRKRKRNSRRRSLRCNIVGCRCYVHFCFVPFSYLPTYSECSHKWCPHYGRCADARLCKEDKPSRYDRGFPCFHNNDNDGIVLFYR